MPRSLTIVITVVVLGFVVLGLVARLSLPDVEGARKVPAEIAAEIRKDARFSAVRVESNTGAVICADAPKELTDGAKRDLERLVKARAGKYASCVIYLVPASEDNRR